MKKKGTSAGIPRGGGGERPSPAANGTQHQVGLFLLPCCFYTRKALFLLHSKFIF